MVIAMAVTVLFVPVTVLMAVTVLFGAVAVLSVKRQVVHDTGRYDDSAALGAAAEATEADVLHLDEPRQHSTRDVSHEAARRVGLVRGPACGAPDEAGQLEGRRRPGKPELGGGALAGRHGEGVEMALVADVGLKERVLTIESNKKISSGNYAGRL